MKALAGSDAPVYTDFLLHDMGERPRTAFAKGTPVLENGVRRRSWACASLQRCSTTAAQRVFARRSWRTASRTRKRGAPWTFFRALPAPDQAELVEFVEAL